MSRFKEHRARAPGQQGHCARLSHPCNWHRLQKYGNVAKKGGEKKRKKKKKSFFFLALFSPPPHSHSQLSFLHLHRSDYPLPPGSNKPLQQVIQIEIVLQCKKRLRKEGRKGEGREKEGRKEGEGRRESCCIRIHIQKRKKRACVVG